MVWMRFRVPSCSSMSSVASAVGCEEPSHWPEHLCCPITREPFEAPVSIIVGGELRTYDEAALLAWFCTLQGQGSPLRDPLSNQGLVRSDGQTAARAEDVPRYLNRSILAQVNEHLETFDLPPRVITRTPQGASLGSVGDAAGAPPQNALVVDLNDPMVQRFRQQIFIFAALKGLTSLISMSAGATTLAALGWAGNTQEASAGSAAMGGVVLGAIFGFFVRSDGRSLSPREVVGAYVGLDATAGLVGASLLSAHASVKVDPREAAAACALGSVLVLLVAYRLLPILARGLMPAP